ncbi:hypothetical protein A3A03_02040 [Candidatus Nomurabacteria bacterium RIFCSPLOWO2_01_FULL_40_18]|uniref:Uncharacterized protein n=1 Tax=Candidatus Nomurabacteria bacterium RIFCSPLOWO2_01_FULL_40_18 TaxID=1801773 RepID=A0A1F6XI15_9BACT|nr:MAG: hypothetical protein A3A03_02040 [Candidatus Nomurabacteria bacterium RIFCSPLOWO2_01_FULL_40_18]
MEENKYMDKLNGSENIEKQKQKVFREIDHDLDKKLANLDGEKKVNEVKRLNDYLNELENKKEEIQKNEGIAERF